MNEVPCFFGFPTFLLAFSIECLRCLSCLNTGILLF